MIAGAQWRSALWLALVLPLVLAQVVLWAGHTIDDAGITFAYIDTWLHGGGLAFRPGEPPVEAYTNALWLFVLTPFAGLGLDLEVVSKVLGLASGLVAAGAIFALARRVARARPWTALLGPLVLWGAPLYGFWVLSGLENGLFTMLLALMVWRAVRDAEDPGARWTSQLPSAALQCAVVMTRPDGILYVAATQVWLLWVAAQADVARRVWLVRWAQRAGLAAGLYLTYFALRYAYFGQVLPNSFAAKSPSQYGGVHLFDLKAPGWDYVITGLEAYRVMVPLALALVLAFAWRPARRLAALATACLLAGLLFPVVAAGDWMFEWRMLSFSWPFVALLLALGAGAAVGLTQALVERLAPRAVALVRFVAPAVGALVVVVAVLFFRGPWVARADARVERVNITVSDLAHRADFWQFVGELSGLHTPRVADVDAGGMTWKQQVGFLDLGKLGDLSIPRHYPETYGQLRDYVFHEDRPDAIHLHGAFYDYKLHEMAEWRERYAPILAGHTRRYEHVFADNVVAVAPFVAAGVDAVVPEARGWEAGETVTPGGRRARLGEVELAVVAGDLHHGVGQGQAPLAWELVGRAGPRGVLPRELWLEPCGRVGAGAGPGADAGADADPGAAEAGAAAAPEAGAAPAPEQAGAPAAGAAPAAAEEAGAPAAAEEEAGAAPAAAEEEAGAAPAAAAAAPEEAAPEAGPERTVGRGAEAGRASGGPGGLAALQHVRRQGLSLKEDRERRDAAPRGLRVAVVWAAGLFDPRALAQRAWVSGVATTPVPAELVGSRCLALTARSGRVEEVLAVTMVAPTRAPLAQVLVGGYLDALAADPRVLLRDERSPVAPARARVICASLGLHDVGACYGWLRDGAAGVEVRALIGAVGASQARARLAAAQGLAGPGREDALVGAGLWIVAAREAAGRIPTTAMSEAWRDASEAVAGELREASETLTDPLGDAGMRFIELAVQVDPSDNRARLAMEDRRPRAASRVRAIEWQLQGELRAALRAAEGRAGAALGVDPAADAAALVASTVREGRLLEGWRCLEVGPCAAYREDPTVAPWAAWLSGVLGLGPAAPRPETRRVVWGFERGSLHGFQLLGAAWGSGPETKPLAGQHQASGYEQNALLDSFHGGDDATGVAESRPFVVEDDFVGMLVGGGVAGSGLRVELVVGDEVVKAGASPRRGPTLDPVVWDLRPWKGQVATLRLVDEAQQAWGHLLVDAITWLR